MAFVLGVGLEPAVDCAGFGGGEANIFGPIRLRLRLPPTPVLRSSNDLAGGATNKRLHSGQHSASPCSSQRSPPHTRSSPGRQPHIAHAASPTRPGTSFCPMYSRHAHPQKAGNRPHCRSGRAKSAWYRFGVVAFDNLQRFARFSVSTLDRHTRRTTWNTLIRMRSY